jgi:CHAD domain-containing protein
VLGQLERDRVEGRARVLDALRSERYFALLATLEEAGAEPPPGRDDTSLRAAARKEFRRLSRAMDRVAEEFSDEAVHRARIKGKRARYATELVEDELGKRGTKLIAAAKRFQDIAGEHQDSVVAEERLRSLAGSRRSQRTALAAGLLVSRQRERRARAAEELPKAWKRLETAAKKAWA